jgi:hypothetical protein
MSTHDFAFVSLCYGRSEEEIVQDMPWPLAAECIIRLRMALALSLPHTIENGDLRLMREFDNRTLYCFWRMIRHTYARPGHTNQI